MRVTSSNNIVVTQLSWYLGLGGRGNALFLYLELGLLAILYCCIVGVLSDVCHYHRSTL